MSEERTGKSLRQVEHIRGHLWYIYSITFEVMTSTELWGTLGSVVSLLAATLYQGNHVRSHKLWNVASTERDILHMQVECCYTWMESSQWENWNRRRTDNKMFIIRLYTFMFKSKHNNSSRNPNFIDMK